MKDETEDSELFLEVMERIARDESGDFVENEDAAANVDYVYRVMKNIVRGEEVRIDQEMHDPFPTSGAVCVRGAKFEVMNPIKFARAAARAQNFEAYSHTDGTVELDFAFAGLATKVGD